MITNRFSKTYESDNMRALEYFEMRKEFTTGPVEVSHMLEEKERDFVIVDVRDEKDYLEGHVPGAVNLPRDQWETLEGLDKERTNILYCYTPTCHLAVKAAVDFASSGYRVVEMEGGFETWAAKDLPTEKGKSAGVQASIAHDGAEPISEKNIQNMVREPKYDLKPGDSPGID